ncbi:hypothetical protein FRB95_010586 [Tulasnella sp. JGI-2019a]|nr:hypothetical protein FRB95_010586 [Tulasnella sp. JGI-2019a]
MATLTDNELFIRSASSLSSIVKPQAIEKRTSREKSPIYENVNEAQKRVERLDRMALLFVTKGFRQVTAVTISQHLGDVAVYGALQTEQAEEKVIDATTLSKDQLSTTKNDPAGAPRMYLHYNEPNPTPERSGASLISPNSHQQNREIEDMELFKSNLDIQTHARNLAFLVNKLSGADPRNRLEESARLRQYVYFQCIEKIKTRFWLRSFIDGPRLFDILEKVTNDLDQVTGPSPFDPADIPASVRRASSERWLDRQLRDFQTLTGEHEILAPISEDGDDSRALLNPTPETMRTLYRYLIMLLQSVKRFIPYVTSAKNVAETRRNAESLSVVMDNVRSLVHRSPSLWRLLQDKHIGSVFKMQGILTQKITTRAPNRRDDNPNDNECDPDEDDVDKTQLEEEIAAQNSPYESIGHWLKCLCHWTTTLNELCDGHYRKRLGSKDLVVKIIEPPPLVERERQASLSKTLAFLKLSPEEEETAWMKLKGIADNKLTKVSKANRVALRGGKADESWATGFKGRVHCECFLASLISGRAANKNQSYSNDLVNCPKYIGVSKRCCFLCSEFIAILSNGIYYSGTHGKVYVWAPPRVSTELEWESQIIETLQRELRACLTTRTRDLEQSEDSGSGSEGSWDSGARSQGVRHIFGLLQDLDQREGSSGSHTQNPS